MGRCRARPFRLTPVVARRVSTRGPMASTPRAVGIERLLQGQTLDAMAILDHCARHDGLKPYLRHDLPGDYSLATHAGCGRLFSSSRLWTRPASRPLARSCARRWT